MLSKNRRNLRRIQLGVKDPKRSFKLRSEGLMKKANDLRILGARVAIYIDGVIDGRHEELSFKTDPNFKHPTWDNLPVSEQLGPDDFGLPADLEQLAPAAPESMASTPRRPEHHPTQPLVETVPRTPPPVAAQPDTGLESSGSVPTSREPSPPIAEAICFDDFAALFGPESDVLSSSPLPSIFDDIESTTDAEPEPITPCSRRERARSTALPSLPESRASPTLRRHSLRQPLTCHRSSPLRRVRSSRPSLSTIKWFED